ncbi:MAG: AAA+ family ATPase [Thermus sp.]|uniref:DUF815 domain-containing protein n=1 Tax=Thermus sp. TaxID=275 RepID=UPI003318C240
MDPALPNTPLDLLSLDLPHGEPWGYALVQALLKAPWAKKALETPPGLLGLVQGELPRFQKWLEEKRKTHPLGPLGNRPATEAEKAVLKAVEESRAEALLEAYRRFGPYPFALYRAFRFDGELRPILRPNLPPREELVGYEAQMAALERNIRRFLAGKPALHTLLYGARGTGKSTLARSLLHLEGLSLIEVELREGKALEALLETLAPLPGRFVLFLDDLSLDPKDTLFHALKALLEGSLIAPPENTLLLATSNRRHLVEHLPENPLPGADPTLWDALQDTLALADRFGLVLTFPPFDQALYLKAVEHHLGRPLEEEEKREALRFAQNRGYSGRSAKQFALSLG